MFPVVDDSNKLLGCITTKQVKEIPREEWANKRVKDVAIPCSEKNTIHPKMDAVKALSLMKRDGTSRLMVTEGSQLVGIIALKDLLEFLSLKVELDEE
jgi:CBS domain-containing protein